MAEANNSCMILLTESHLNSNIPDCILTKEGWTVIRADREKRICGGVIGIVRYEFPIGAKLSFSTSYCEVIDMYFSSINLINITIYRPQNVRKTILIL